MVGVLIVVLILLWVFSSVHLESKKIIESQTTERKGDRQMNTCERCGKEKEDVKESFVFDLNLCEVCLENMHHDEIMDYGLA